MATVRFPTLGAEVACSDGSTLFDAGGRAAAGIDTACVGKGTCGLCRVKVVAGGELLTPYTDEERKHLGNVHHITKVRLACRAHIVAGAAEGVIEVEVVVPRARKSKR